MTGRARAVVQDCTMVRKYAGFGIIDAQHKTAPAGASTPNRSLTDSLDLTKERLSMIVYHRFPAVNNDGPPISQSVTEYRIGGAR